MTQQTPQPPAEPAPTRPPTIGELIARISENVSALVKGEIDLAKAKGRRMVATMGVGAGLLGAAGLVALYGLGFLLGAASEALALVLPLWAAKLIVALVLFLVAAVAAYLGKRKLDAARADVPTPDKNLKEDVAMLKAAASSGLQKGAEQ
ncbi:MAG: phage holin family protein [Actinomyces sp.]|uniref:phage holin family protein n=1 Tax=Actinomyces sp. TaxID=29317 RepID=UPI0026DB04E1|nr:phage holin family protein [Actinomyces sp.]MDO4243579.1 phage holin family protein [Actinomyces sp.]